jgi:predicted DNA-binding antitoxin AbrB/MazE fold protein
MTQKVEAIYSGGVLKPTHELRLRDERRVRLTVETIDEPERDRPPLRALKRASPACVFSRRGRFPAERNCMIAVDTNVLIYACDQAEVSSFGRWRRPISSRLPAGTTSNKLVSAPASLATSIRCSDGFVRGRRSFR